MGSELLNYNELKRILEKYQDKNKIYKFTYSTKFTMYLYSRQFCTINDMINYHLPDIVNKVELIKNPDIIKFFAMHDYIDDTLLFKYKFKGV